MTMAGMYSVPVYGKEHRILKKRTLACSFLDLIFITSTVVFVIIQLVSIDVTYSSVNVSPDSLEGTNITRLQDNSEINGLQLQSENGVVVNANVNGDKVTSDSDGEYSDPDMYPTSIEHDHKDNGTSILNLNHNSTNGCNSTSEEECQSEDSLDDGFLYRSVIGARISLSIQLIIYVTQLGFGVLLFIAAYHNDSRNLHLWVLFSEVVVVVVCLYLFINFFGKFVWIVAVITGLYIVFKIFLIRLVRRFIIVNDLELTQFGSVAEFE